LKRMKSTGTLLLILLVFLSACKGSQAEQLDTSSPEAVFTAAAQTAEARRLLLPTNTPPVSPETLATTSIAPTATLALAGATQPAVQPTAPASAGISANDRAEFVSDVTVPDGTIFAPNEPFVKTWRVKNIGTTTWTSDYALIFIDGDQFSADTTVPLPAAVAPGETADLSVEMIAPEKAGIFQGFWKLSNANREVFGVGADALDAMWLIISVSETAEPVSTLPSLVGGQKLTNISFRVDTPTYEGACPKSLVFSGEFTLASPATVTYTLEAGNKDGTGIKLPGTITRNLEAGTHSVQLELVIGYSMDGWARLKFIAPEEITSHQVEFSLVCK